VRIFQGTTKGKDIPGRKNSSVMICMQGAGRAWNIEYSSNAQEEPGQVEKDPTTGDILCPTRIWILYIGNGVFIRE
jgi:hypothetical protein